MSGLHEGARPIYYKTDAQTNSGIYSDGQQRPWIYSSATIRIEQKSDKKEPIASICLTKDTKEQTSAKRKKYNDDDEKEVGPGPVNLISDSASSSSLFKGTLKRSSELPSKINFLQAKKLIQEGKFFDAGAIDFDINNIHTETGKGLHDSKSYENEFTYTIEQTLLHIAIQVKNELMIAQLLEHGADTSILFKKTEERKQRQFLGHNRSGHKHDWGEKWSEWRDFDPAITTLSIQELADKTGDAGIISMISAKIASRVSPS